MSEQLCMYRPARGLGREKIAEAGMPRVSLFSLRFDRAGKRRRSPFSRRLIAWEN
jgi:hypothetical protein